MKVKTIGSGESAYTVTMAPTYTPDGREGLRLTCQCGGCGGAQAILVYPMDVAPLPAERVHGWVVAAGNPLNIAMSKTPLAQVWEA